MKNGFRLLLHKSLSEDEKTEAKKVFDRSFIETNGIYKCRSDSGAFFRRNLLGYQPDNTRWTVRRMSTTRRIFAAIPVDLVERVDGEPLELNQCVCAIHKGGQRVRLKQPMTESDYDIYHEQGEIKG